jgi:hypothetical protein
MIRGIAIAPAHNTPGINARTGGPWRDASGAFIPEAAAFARRHGLPPIVLFDNTQPYASRRGRVERALAGAAGPLDVVAIFAHGWRDGIQTGHLRPHAKRLAGLLAKVSTPALCVALYACDTARDGDKDRKDDDDPGPGGEGGWADLLRDELVLAGVSQCRVLAHGTAAHTTRNAYLREFRADQSTGGTWIVEPDSTLWPAWGRALAGPLRFDLPLLSAMQIRERLAAGA